MTKASPKTVLLRGGSVSYTIKRHPRAKSVHIRVSGEGKLSVTAPRWVPNYFIEQAVKGKEAWILKMFSRMPPPSRTIDHGALYQKHKEAARELVWRRLEYFNQFYGFSWNTISIRNQKTRWGSCSRKKNLNFHYKLALVPEPLADYVIVHELCHLQEFNHSKKFWDLVARGVPDHPSRKKELRRYGI